MLLQPAFQQVDGRDDRTRSGRQHRVVEISAMRSSMFDTASGNKVLAQAFFVTVHPDYADTRARHIFQNAFIIPSRPARRIGTTVIFLPFDLVDFHRPFQPSMVTFPALCVGCRFIRQQAAYF